MDKVEVDKAADLWRKIGALRALADPNGFIAKKMGDTAEERLRQIWEVLQTIQP